MDGLEVLRALRVDRRFGHREDSNGNLSTVTFAGGTARSYAVAVRFDGTLGFVTSENEGLVDAFDFSTNLEVTAGGFYPLRVGSTPRAVAAH